MTGQPLLRVEDLSVSFAGNETPVVESLNFDMGHNQTLGIVGESGSGKSVSCHALLGLLPRAGRATGHGWFRGMDLLHTGEKDLRQVRGRQISMIFQDPVLALNPYMPVGRQIAEPLAVHHGVGWRQARQRVVRLLDEVGIADAERRINHYPHEFSGGMCQRVMIAMALITEPALLIADEPTSALDVQVQEQILDMIKQLQSDRQMGVVLISHDLDVVRRVADKVLVMCKGVNVEQGDVDGLLDHPRHPYTRSLVEAIPHENKPGQYRHDLTPADSLLTLRGVEVWFGGRRGKSGFRAVHNVSLDVREGEVLGVVGESGSGKTTLSRAVVRLLGLSGGEVWLGGQPLHTMSRRQLRPLRKTIQMIFQDPYGSLDPRMTVQQIITEPILLHGLAKDRAAANAIADRLLQEVQLDPVVAKRYPHQFSGGQRQRVAIARALACEPRLLIADEVVSALDVTVQAQILELLLELVSRRGLSMVFISHDLAVVRYVSDRVAVMKDGEVVELGETEQIMSAPTHDYTRQLVSLTGQRSAGGNQIISSGTGPSGAE